MDLEILSNSGMALLAFFDGGYRTFTKILGIGHV
jgi:hypothetical protein